MAGWGAAGRNRVGQDRLGGTERGRARLGAFPVEPPGRQKIGFTWNRVQLTSWSCHRNARRVRSKFRSGKVENFSNLTSRDIVYFIARSHCTRSAIDCVPNQTAGFRYNLQFCSIIDMQSRHLSASGNTGNSPNQ